MTADPELFTGQDAECCYLVTVHDDGVVELATRPRTDPYTQRSVRWSPPIRLTPEPIGAGR